MEICSTETIVAYLIPISNEGGNLISSMFVFDSKLDPNSGLHAKNQR